MYIELMRKNQNAHALDSALTGIGASLSPYIETRTALFNAAAKAEHGKMNLSAADLINLQKQQTDMRQRALRQTLLPALAKEHQLSPETIAALESAGKLDDVLQAFVTKGLVHIKNDANGETTFFDRHGNKVASAGGGLKPTDDQIELAAANKLRPPDQQLTMEQWLSTVKRAPPAATDEAILASINKDRPPEDQMKMEFFQTHIKHRPTTEVNVSADGVTFPKLPPGEDYYRDEKGKVKIFEDGKPKSYVISPKVAGTMEHTAVQTATDQFKLDELKKKEHKEKIGAAFAASNVGTAVDQALINADKPVASGFGSRWAAQYSPGGLPIDDLKANLSTINANTAIQTLQAMRAASPTGGAVGNVSDFEQKMLSSTIGNLDPYQGPEQLKKALIRVKAGIHVLAEQNYTEADTAKFNKALNDKIEEFTKLHLETTTPGKPTVTRIPRGQ
jgi:hypothetical protein